MLRNIVRNKPLEMNLREVSSADVARDFATYRKIAEGVDGSPEPVGVTHYNKPSIVIVATEEYQRLKRRDKKVYTIEDLPETLVDLVETGQMDAKFDYLNDGL
jgi:hypothetical protein